MSDPTWFRPAVDIAERLEWQREVKGDPRLQHARRCDCLDSGRDFDPEGS